MAYAAEERRTGDEPTDVTGDLPGPRPRLLVVDDDPEALDALVAALADERFAIEAYVDARQALLAIEAARPTLVVTDLGMPEVSGRDLLKAVRGRWSASDPAVIVLSGVGDEDVMLDCFSLGATDYLTKPVTLPELRAKVAVLVSRIEAARAEAAALATGPTAPGGAGASAGVLDPGNLELGSRFGAYRITGRLGAGGMGVVYQAESEEHGTVALKVLAPDLAKDRALLARFFREARHLRSIRHPHVVSFYELGHHAGAYFLVMECAAGSPLDVRYEGALPLDEPHALFVIAQIAEALEVLHAAHLVHRDLKPANVMIDEQDHVKLVDFGLVKRPVDAKLTDTDVLVGTPHYLAPERITGSHPLDIRSDLYAVGVLLFYLLAGRPPFVGETPFAVLQGHACATAPSLREANPRVSEHTSAVVARLLEKDPNRRFQTPTELLAAVRV